MNNCQSPLFWGSLLVLMQGLSGAPHPGRVREVDLNRIIREPDIRAWTASGHPVEDISFSPDERWIAVAVGGHWQKGPVDRQVGRRSLSHILVLPVKAEGVRFEADIPYLVGENTFHWAPDSEHLEIAAEPSLMYSIASGEMRQFGPRTREGGTFLGFVGMDRAIRIKPPALSGVDPLNAAREWRRGLMTLQTIDLDGRVLEEFTLPKDWEGAMRTINPDRHLMVFETSIPYDKCGERDCASRFVVDYTTKRVVQRWEWPGGPLGQTYFAEAGRTLCGATDSGRDSRWTQCYDVASGERVAEFKGFKGGYPAAASVGASRMVLSHIDLIRGINEEFDRDSYKDRVVWDFRAGGEVAEWTPLTRVQEHDYDGTSTRRTTGWGPFAISSSGHYLAEGGNGTLRIYEIP